MSSDATGSSPSPQTDLDAAGRYRAALRRLSSSTLADILQSLNSPERPTRPTELVAAVVDRLAETRFVEGLIGRLGHPARMMLGLFAIQESTVWPRAGLAHAMASLGANAEVAIAETGLHGLVLPAPEAEGSPDDLVAHPVILTAARTVLPDGTFGEGVISTRQVRESDGLEPILRLAALWQRVEEDPLRRTQNGVLYKKDRERIEDDPVLAGPIADSLEPLPDPANLWLTLARAVGLVIDERNSDRTIAAPADFWGEHAVHLPQMLALRWLGTRAWSESGGLVNEDAPVAVASPHLRVAAMLWLATVEPKCWVGLDELAAHLDRVYPGWSTPLIAGDGSAERSASRGRIGAEARRDPSRRRSNEPPAAAPSGESILASILLGPAYQLGLVRSAEEDPSGRRLVALTELGRYVLALGRPPQPRETFPEFLFVQPNFEVIAYRQGLNAPLIGALSRFMMWTQSGAALEMKLTPESVYRGLEGGMTPEAMLDRLAKHSARALSAGVAEAIKTWAGRRDRISYFASATLIEFSSPQALQDGLAAFAAEGRPEPVTISERVLLVEDESTIPFAAFKLAGSRDYTRPPEACVSVEPDGVTLAIDLGRSDLFIDAELAKFADLLPDDGRAGAPRRRYHVSSESLRRAVEDGLTGATISRWFGQRAGVEVPPALRLLIHAAGANPEPFGVATRIVLTAPSGDLLEGLMQHPQTSTLLGTRLGPMTVEVPERNVEPLRAALARFGLDLRRDSTRAD